MQPEPAAETAALLSDLAAIERRTAQTLEWAMNVFRFGLLDIALATRGGNPQKGWQGGMRLHLADTLLHRARLFGWRNEYLWPRTPQTDLDDAEALIEACGYHRRDQELADARAALG